MLKGIGRLIINAAYLHWTRKTAEMPCAAYLNIAITAHRVLVEQKKMKTADLRQYRYCNYSSYESKDTVCESNSQSTSHPGKSNEDRDNIRWILSEETARQIDVSKSAFAHTAEEQKPTNTTDDGLSKHANAVAI